jgi:hypothetical protein
MTMPLMMGVMISTGPFEFDFEEEQLTEQTIRELVFEEARCEQCEDAWIKC